MRRLTLRAIVAVSLLGVLYSIYALVHKFRASIQQTADYLANLEQVNQIHVDPHDVQRNRSGVADSRTRTIVMAKRSDENTSWVEHDLPQWQRAIYTVDDSTAELHTAQDKGREANAYLTFLVENYDALPDFMVFLHSHREGFPRAWHVDNEGYSNVISVLNLRLDFVERNGYANLRCLYEPGCTDGLVPFRTPHNPALTHERGFPRAWKEMMGDEPIPRVIGIACCSQFAVSKEQVLKRPKEDYVRYYNWLMNTELSDEYSGRILEYMWHIIFGQDPVYCPELNTCYCNVYGNCRGVQQRGMNVDIET